MGCSRKGSQIQTALFDSDMVLMLMMISSGGKMGSYFWLWERVLPSEIKSIIDCTRLHVKQLILSLLLCHFYSLHSVRRTFASSPSWNSYFLMIICFKIFHFLYHWLAVTGNDPTSKHQCLFQLLSVKTSSLLVSEPNWWLKRIFLDQAPAPGQWKQTQSLD